MKQLLIFAIGAALLSACSGNAYRLSEYEKEAQRGFHANQAKKIIETNDKNKKINKKAAEKSKKEQNDHLNALNRNKTKNGTTNNRTFKFY